MIENRRKKLDEEINDLMNRIQDNEEGGNDDNEEEEEEHEERENEDDENHPSRGEEKMGDSEGEERKERNRNSNREEKENNGSFQDDDKEEMEMNERELRDKEREQGTRSTQDTVRKATEHHGVAIMLSKWMTTHLCCQCRDLKTTSATTLCKERRNHTFKIHQQRDTINGK